MKQNTHGFTVVEILIVFVVIGILTAITLVVFSGVQSRAGTALLQSDLKAAATQLGADNATAGAYPSSLDAANGNKGVNKSSGTTYVYTYTAADNSFCLTAFSSRKNVSSLMISNTDTSPQEGSCAGHHDPNSPPPSTVASCFAFTASIGSITDYYTHEGNNPANPACPRDVSIPRTINGTIVKQIGYYALSGDQLSSVVIPDTVTSIGISAFSYNNLTTVVIPISVTQLSTSAFQNNQITTATLPSNITTVPASLFQNNKLTSITIPEGVTTIGNFAFRENNLASVTLPNSLTTINSSVFHFNKLTSVTLPSSLKTIGTSAFQGNKLTSLTVPSSVTSIGARAFMGAVFPSVALPAHTTIASDTFPAGVTITRY